MLIQYSQIEFLDAAAKERLKAAVSGTLLQTNEAKLGYVVFEGKNYAVASVKQLVNVKPQILKG